MIHTPLSYTSQPSQVFKTMIRDTNFPTTFLCGAL